MDTLERVEILEDFKAGRFDVLVGVNLLREGLDLPSVSLVAILDADKEGFLRSDRALTQIAGRAARNINGVVLMYADTITGSMQRTIDETNRRRAKQQAYNEAHGIVPKQVKNDKKNTLVAGYNGSFDDDGPDLGTILAEDPVVARMSPKELTKAIEAARKNMEQAARDLDFLRAAKFRDEMYELQKRLR